MQPLNALTFHQPYATLIMMGVKRFEIRTAPLNGDMKPFGVRGMPGRRVNRGDHLVVHAAKRTPHQLEGLRNRHGEPMHVAKWQGMWALVDDDERLLVTLPLGVALGTARVIGQQRISNDPQDNDVIWMTDDGRVTRTAHEQLRASSYDWEDDLTAHLPVSPFEHDHWAIELAPSEYFPNPSPKTGNQGVWRYER